MLIDVSEREKRGKMKVQVVAKETQLCGDRPRLEFL